MEIMIRLLAAIAFADLAVDQAVGGRWNTLYWVLATVLAVTALSGFCPLYALFRPHRGDSHKQHQ